MRKTMTPTVPVSSTMDSQSQPEPERRVLTSPAVSDAEVSPSYAEADAVDARIANDENTKRRTTAIESRRSRANAPSAVVAQGKGLSSVRSNDV